jgi:hypothetical protein
MCRPELACYRRGSLREPHTSVDKNCHVNALPEGATHECRPELMCYRRGSLREPHTSVDQNCHVNAEAPSGSHTHV